VDDDLYRCQLYADGLRRQGYVADTAADAETGWAELQTHRYNLLITENDLPGLTGVGLLKKLHSACMSLPVIIAIETLPSWQSANYPWLLKATKLFKPFTFDHLVDLVGRILPTPGRRREAMTPLPNWRNQTASVALQLC